ncbi:hypothetical protein [Thiovibrio frasassiensis]|uniref:Quinohemoprotein amine dehydrogenase alpha subunit haem binding domain-containing protein n=1 Tax=Thiovibrio frasassiensis TaxID=2984131 RepID=A0A9X4MFQ1_9BACT|nr:hypothetical protein [Thiovibrio frasassiensis]MDG4475496.1 hypothetical protein [Thiovibrio frasassiensis]
MKPFALLALLLLFSLGATTAAFAGGTQCTELLNSRCQVCHYKSRICQRLGQKSKGEWKRSIGNMMRYGAKITEAEGKILAQCLNAAPVGAEFVCKN